MPQRRTIQSRSTAALLLASVAIIVAGLYFARVVLVPLALGILLSFLLAPLVSRLERLGLGRVVSVLLSACLGFAAMGVIVWVVWFQVTDLTHKLPRYQTNIQTKTRALRGSTELLMGSARKFLSQFGSGTAPESQPQSPPVAGPSPVPPPPTPAAASATRPVPVEVVEPPATPLQILRSAIGPLIEPLAVTGLVIIFVVFILIQREDLRDRLIRLISRDQLQVTTAALDDASRRISRFLLMQLIINAIYGVCIGVGLWVIGVPNPVLWGLIAAISRYIPYVGVWLGAAMPVLLALAVSESWRMPVFTIGLYVVVEIVAANVLEPLLFGSSTGISPLAVLVAAVFWTWLWGMPGLLLAMPMTVLLAVVGKYVPQLQFLNILLGDQPVLEPRTRVYQRLLAGDVDEAATLVEQALKQQSLLAAYDQVLMPALGMAEKDRHAGMLDEQRQQFIHDAITEMMEEYAQRQGLPGAKAAALSVMPAEPGSKQSGEASEPCVICLPAHDAADQIVATMLAQVLAQHGCAAKVIPHSALTSEMVDAVARGNVRFLCISAIPPTAAAHARYLLKRLRARLGAVSYIVGMWAARGDLSSATQRLQQIAPVQVVRTLSQAVEQITSLVRSMGKATEPTPPTRNAPAPLTSSLQPHP